LKAIGKVKVRRCAQHVRRGEPSLEVTIPRTVKIFFDIKQGDVLDVFVDEENRRIIFQQS